MKRQRLIQVALEVLVTAALVVGAHSWGAVWAALGWSVLAVGRLWQRPDRSSALSAWALETILGWSLIILVVLNHAWVTQVCLGLVYLAWRVTALPSEHLKLRLWRLGGAFFFSMMAVFTATAVWRWPVLVVIVLAWSISWLVARQLLDLSDRGAAVLAATWALIAAEISYLFAIWLVSYILPNSVLIVPQAAIVLLALGYCFMSIYIAHVNAKLSRSRLAEYVIIGLCLLIIVMAGTKWNGAI